ncbi:hypothetical protein B0T18DRAFT_412156 [Schizothecium vesticola]|uniref:Uncharacterized protein n=1 Tax=Schizothecium vesticola TaxID=314040 RepID=A0AA40EW96_9PEZI|nr:hypothetical protein B0T18DRAFT_412156 [Schizothecium vesticola]
MMERGPSAWVVRGVSFVICWNWMGLFGFAWSMEYPGSARRWGWKIGIFGVSALGLHWREEARTASALGGSW